MGAMPGLQEGECMTGGREGQVGQVCSQNKNKLRNFCRRHNAQLWIPMYEIDEAIEKAGLSGIGSV